MQINSQPLSYVIYDHIFCTQNNRLFKQIGLFTQGEPVLNSEKYTVPILVFYGKSIKLLGAGQWAQGPLVSVEPECRLCRVQVSPCATSRDTDPGQMQN